MALFRWRSEPNSIYDCCRLLCGLQFFLGCSGIRSRFGKYTCDWISLMYTPVAMICIVGVLLITAYVKFQDPYFVEMDSLIKSIIVLELGMSLFMYLVTGVSMMARTSTHLQLYRSINELDGILIRKFHCNMNYKTLVKRHVIFIMFTNLIDLAIIILGASRATNLKDLAVNIMAALAYSFVTGGPHLNFYIQMNFAKILAIRFRLLQKLLKSQWKIRSPHELDESRHVERLQLLIDLVQRYHDCISLTNRVFSMSMVIIMLHDFTLTTSELYLIFGGLTGSGSSALIYFVLLGLVLPVYKMTVGPMYSEKSITEGDECFKIIQDLDFHYPGNKQIRQMVSDSLTWRWDNKIQFYSGSMKLNMATIAGVYLEIFNYILILIQFRMTQEMGDQIEKQKNTIQDWIGVDYM
ncbi:gustatory receptor 57a [Haematobia irritans]|uniref:gustatory receptor 57a n=1 Tax=Haematobia irritans TaxID=7368 RepID=UPI003F50871A